MVRFRHTVSLEPVPRDWFEQMVELGHDTLTEYVEQVDGAPPRRDTRYASDDGTIEVIVDSWYRQGLTAGRVHIVDDESMAICHVRLDSAAAPRTVDVEWDFRMTTRGISWLTATTGTARLDLDRWWAGSPRPGGDPAVKARGRYAIVRGSFAATPELGDRWRVTVTGRLRGRGLLRPLAAIGLLIGRRRLKDAVRSAMDKFGERWNDEVPDLVARQPDEIRELIKAELAKTHSLE